MRSYSRSDRVADEIQRLLSQLVRAELKDPRVHLLTITDVEVSSDLSHAKIFVTTLDGGEAQRDETLKGLNHAAGFLRSMLGKQLKLRVVPQLHFTYDASVEQGMRLASLIDRAVAEDEAHHPAADDVAPDDKQH